MTGRDEVARNAQEAADLTERLLRGEPDEQLPAAGPPVRWSDLTRVEAAEEWPRLYVWVEQLRVRYPNSLRLPACWWRHNDLVEALQALRDFERASFAPTAPATDAVEWQRAFRDVEARLEIWVRRLPCAVTGRGHDRQFLVEGLPDDWAAVIADDLTRRR